MSPSQPPQVRFQMSIGFMMLLMVVFAVMSAGLFYASRVPMIRDEISVLFYGKASGGEDVGRVAHKAFIMFTFASPLLLAAAISTIISVVRWFERLMANPGTKRDFKVTFNDSSFDVPNEK